MLFMFCFYSFFLKLKFNCETTITTLKIVGELTLEEKEHEKQVHAQSLNFAKESITKRVPNFTNPIVKLLIDLNGTVGKLNEDGTWIIIHIEPRSNPNGLWWS